MKQSVSLNNSPSGCGPWLNARIARMHGFTLIELMVTIGILGILVAVAIPSFNSALISYRLTSISNNFVASAQLTRSEAIKRNSRVALCKSVDGSVCTESGGWHQGWIVFHDANNNGARDSGEAVIHQVQALPARLRLNGNLNVANYVSFSPTGETKLVSDAFQAGTLTLCHESASGTEARQIVISGVGRLRVEKDTVTVCP